MKYHVTYSVEPHPEGVEREDIPPNTGACTAILVGSLLYPEDGSYSAMFVSRDGRTGEELSSAEVWKAWAMLAAKLADAESLSPGKRALCRDVFERVRLAVLAAPEPERPS